MDGPNTLRGIFCSSWFFHGASCFFVRSVTFVLATEHVQYNFLFLPGRTAVVKIILNPFALGGLGWYSVCGVDAGGSSYPMGHINPTQPKVLTHPGTFFWHGLRSRPWVTGWPWSKSFRQANWPVVWKHIHYSKEFCLCIMNGCVTGHCIILSFLTLLSFYPKDKMS